MEVEDQKQVLKLFIAIVIIIPIQKINKIEDLNIRSIVTWF